MLLECVEKKKKDWTAVRWMDLIRMAMGVLLKDLKSQVGIKSFWKRSFCVIDLRINTNMMQIINKIFDQANIHYASLYGTSCCHHISFIWRYQLVKFITLLKIKNKNLCSLIPEVLPFYSTLHGEKMNCLHLLHPSLFHVFYLIICPPSQF